MFLLYRKFRVLHYWKSSRSQVEKKLEIKNGNWRIKSQWIVLLDIFFSYRREMGDAVFELGFGNWLHHEECNNFQSEYRKTHTQRISNNGRSHFGTIECWTASITAPTIIQTNKTTTNWQEKSYAARRFELMMELRKNNHFRNNLILDL